MPRFEDRLRKRYPYSLNGWTITLTEDERDALADSVEALREFFAEYDSPGGNYAPSDATEDKMRAALVRLDADA